MKKKRASKDNIRLQKKRKKTTVRKNIQEKKKAGKKEKKKSNEKTDDKTNNEKNQQKGKNLRTQDDVSIRRSQSEEDNEGENLKMRGEKRKKEFQVKGTEQRDQY